MSKVPRIQNQLVCCAWENIFAMADACQIFALVVFITKPIFYVELCLSQIIIEAFWIREKKLYFLKFDKRIIYFVNHLTFR